MQAAAPCADPGEPTVGSAAPVTTHCAPVPPIAGCSREGPPRRGRTVPDGAAGRRADAARRTAGLELGLVETTDGMEKKNMWKFIDL